MNVHSVKFQVAIRRQMIEVEKTDRKIRARRGYRVGVWRKKKSESPQTTVHFRRVLAKAPIDGADDLARELGNSRGEVQGWLTRMVTIGWLYRGPKTRNPKTGNLRRRWDITNEGRRILKENANA